MKDAGLAKDMYVLGLGDEMQFTDESFVVRVPGGWVITYYRENGTGAYDMSSCFIPFDNEFQS